MGKAFAAIVVIVCLAGHALAADDDPAHVADDATQILASDSISAVVRAQTLVTRGLARETLGRPQDAYADFTEALSLHALSAGEIARARFDRGVVLEEMKRIDDAIADYTAAINLEPRFASALNNRANAYRRLGQIDNAARDYIASLNSGNPQPEYSLYGLGQISEALGRTDAARAYYQQALSFNPHFELAAQRLAVFNGPGPLRLPPLITSSTDLKPSITEPKPALPSGSASIQLGAFRAEAVAAAEWNKIALRLGGLFDGFTPHISAVDVPGKGRFWRLQTGPFPDASAACAKVVAQGLACFAVRGENPVADVAPSH